MIIDAHTHIYPNKIAQRAVDSVRDFYCLEQMYSVEGTPEALLESAKKAGIDRCVVCSVAVKPATVESINNFILEQVQAHPEFIGLMAMHQGYEDPEAEIKRMKAAGFKGIKIHPDTQRVNADDPRLMDVYAIAEELGLAILMHTGDYRYDYSHPRRIREILRAFPNLKMDAAHFGGWSIYDIGADYLRDERCWVDTSSSFQMTGLRHGAELINMFGTDRVLFGSDFPMWGPGDEVDALNKLGLDDAAYERVSHKNAEELYGL